MKIRLLLYLIVLPYITIVILSAIRFYTSDNSNDCMKEYILKGGEYGTLMKFPSGNHIEYGRVIFDNVPVVGEADGCWMGYDNVLDTITNSIYCKVSKTLLSLK